MSKAQERERRRQEKELKQAEAKSLLLERTLGPQTPKIATSTTNSSAPRVAPHIARELGAKEQAPKALSEEELLKQRVTWCVEKKDVEGAWSWGEARAWTDDEGATIEEKFADFSRETWGNVRAQTAKSGRFYHHAQELHELVKEAQDRWVARDLEEFADGIFRFRLAKSVRAWGYVVQAHFHMVWLDRNHQIYKTQALSARKASDR